MREIGIDVGELVGLAGELVRIPSHPGLERQEEPVALHLQGWLAAHGVPAELVEVRPGRPNLIATVHGRDPGRHLVLCGHTDTVPLNADDPGFGFAGEVRDGRLVGRGSVDMKGAVAAMAAVLAGAAGRGGLTRGSLTLAALVDEEMEGWGAEHFATRGFAADGAIVGEPTENRPCLGHKGLEWLEIEIRGRAAHGGTPERGVNAIAAAGRLVARVECDLAPRLRERTHPLLGPPTLNFGTIRGGDQPSTVAASCVLALDRRSVPGETYATLVGELEEILGGITAEMPGLVTDVRRFPGGAGTLDRDAFATAPDHPLARALREACEEATGAAPEFGAFPAWTDGGMLANHAGIPTVILGPGDLSLAHSPRESVAVADLETAARIYAATASRFCGTVA